MQRLDRLAWPALAGAIAVAVPLILWLNRGGTYFADDFAWFALSPGLDLPGLFEPENGHLVLIPRALYMGVLEVFGSDYLAFRVIHVLVATASAVLFFVYARRRVQPALAALPAILLLFLGSAWLHTVVPQGITAIGSVGAGIGALIVFDRGDRRGDLGACVLLVISLLTYSTGLAFAAGIAVHILLGSARWRRLWVVAVPIGLYAIWWLSRAGGENETADQVLLSNVLQVPSWIFESLALTLASLLGLGYDADLSPQKLELGAGRLLALLAIAWVGWRIWRGLMTRAMWAALAIPVTYWVLGAMTSGVLERVANTPRYVYPASVGVLVFAAEAARGVRVQSRWLIVVAAVWAVSLATNLVLLRDGASDYRERYSAPARAQLTALELAGDRITAGFNPGGAGAVSFEFAHAWHQIGLVEAERAQIYLAAAERYGSPAFGIEELARQPEHVLVAADAMLADAQAITLGDARAGACRALQTGSVELEAGLVVLRVDGHAPADIHLRRFAAASSPAVVLGTVVPGEPFSVALPEDGSKRPWLLTTTAGALEACEDR